MEQDIKQIKKEMYDKIRSYTDPVECRNYSYYIFSVLGLDTFFHVWSECNRMEKVLNDKRSKKNIILNRIDFMITERCSLRCRECLNLMQYYQYPLNYDLDTMKRNLEILNHNIDEIIELRILGGEPFMNPLVYEVCEFAGELEHIRNVVVFTNGTIVPEKDKLDKIKKNKTCFYMRLLA